MPTEGNWIKIKEIWEVKIKDKKPDSILTVRVITGIKIFTLVFIILISIFLISLFFIDLGMLSKANQYLSFNFFEWVLLLNWELILNSLLGVFIAYLIFKNSDWKGAKYSFYLVSLSFVFVIIIGFNLSTNNYINQFNLNINNYLIRKNLEKNAWQRVSNRNIFYGELKAKKIHDNQDVTITLEFQNEKSDFLMLKPEFVPEEGSLMWVRYSQTKNSNQERILIDMGLEEQV